MVILNKKGMDISLNFVILAVLALIALILIALFFTGGLANLFGQTEDVGSISSEKIALYESKCNFYCTTQDESAWDEPHFPEEFKADGKTKCTDLVDDKEFVTNTETQERECVSKS